MSADAPASCQIVPVWGLAVRVLHWSLVLAVAIAWLTRHSPGQWHEWLGYATLAIVAARTTWGFLGSGYARFVEFVRPAAVTTAYARDVMARCEKRYVGHNPLGGWMVVALLALVSLVGLTGWLYTTDRFWGIDWVERLHSTLSDMLFVFVGFHILGVVFTSIRHHENLPASMLHGRKREEDTGERSDIVPGT